MSLLFMEMIVAFHREGRKLFVSQQLKDFLTEIVKQVTAKIIIQNNSKLLMHESDFKIKR
jgi:hypothetical protein